MEVGEDLKKVDKAEIELQNVDILKLRKTGNKMTIRDWKKLPNTLYDIWIRKNEFNERAIKVKPQTIDGQKLYVIMLTRHSASHWKVLRRFRTKTQALSSAKVYMRKN